MWKTLRSSSPTQVYTLPETHSLPLKMDGCKTILSFWGKTPIFRCYVSFREGIVWNVLTPYFRGIHKVGKPAHHYHWGLIIHRIHFSPSKSILMNLSTFPGISPGCFFCTFLFLFLPGFILLYFVRSSVLARQLQGGKDETWESRSGESPGGKEVAWLERENAAVFSPKKWRQLPSPKKAGLVFLGQWWLNLECLSSPNWDSILMFVSH